MRRGLEKDVKEAEKIYCQAKRRMKEAGLNQWQGPYPSGEDFLSDVGKGQAYVWEEHGKLVGLAACILGEEKTYRKIQGVWVYPGSYLTIHRLAIGDEGLGKGLSYEIFREIQRAFEGKVDNIRIDTHRENIPMQKILKNLDYRYAGIIQVADGSNRDAFEKELRKK